MYIFEGNWITSLLRRPEYGMGYQRIRATLSNGHDQTGYVFNAELFVPDEDRSLQKLTESHIIFAKALNQADRAYPDIRSFEVIPRYMTKSLSSGHELSKNILKESKGAANGPAELTTNFEVFKRFTAYQNDRRITSNGGLVPGTYSTTEADARNVHTGQQAVSRYALPNPEPAIYRFTIKPPKDTKIQRGTVQPANNQSGGGAEVIFADGTAAKSVTGPDTIPEA